MGLVYVRLLDTYSGDRQPSGGKVLVTTVCM